MQRNGILIFGGSFDPPHNGHVNIVHAVMQNFGFSKCIIIPCKLQTLKGKQIASSTDRLAMLKLAFSGSEFIIDDQEITRDTPSYMSVTLTNLQQQYPHNPLTLLMGMDSLLTLPSWHDWHKILQLVNIIAVTRATTEELPTALQPYILNHQIIFYHAGNYAISSTELRTKITQGLNISHCVPPLVAEYIIKNNLYRIT